MLIDFDPGREFEHEYLFSNIAELVAKLNLEELFEVTYGDSAKELNSTANTEVAKALLSSARGKYMILVSESIVGFMVLVVK